MATYSIKWLRNFFGTKFFPITHITAVRDNNNVNLETLLNNKADEATTLAGYGITDAYTKTDSNSRFYALSGVTYTSGSSIDVTTLDAGTYYISSVDQLTDPPTESRNGLSTYFWVLKPNDRHTIIRLQISDSPNIWEKYYMASSGWSNWVLVQNDLDNYYTKAAGKSTFYSLKNDGTMGIDAYPQAPVDLNTIITVGNYYIKFNSGSASNNLQNYPNETRIESTTNVGNPHLHVLQTDSGVIKQQFQWNKSQVLWERKTTDGGTTWTDWVVITMDLYNNFIGLKGQTLITPSDSNLVDLDTFKTVGTYTINYKESIRQYISNMPSDYLNYSRTTHAPFNLYVINTDPTQSAYVLQRIRSDRQNYQAWERTYIGVPNGGWSDWALVQDDLSKYALSEGSSSDARLKDKVDDINLNVEDIAKAPNLTFKWKDKKDNNLHGGTYAQYWENITPYYVHGSDSKTLEYGNLALTCSIELAKEMTKLKEENVQLKKELEDIKETLNKLNK